MKTEARVSEKTLALVVNAVRRIMRWDLLQDVGQRKFGGWGKIVVIDETYWKKQKTTRGGFRSRPSGAEKYAFSASAKSIWRLEHVLVTSGLSKSRVLPRHASVSKSSCM